ncbi:MAG: cob(I)yrinic acid a,c-diamide adenosyltransferase [Candidatus Micrarchaeia archaeon]
MPFYTGLGDNGKSGTMDESGIDKSSDIFEAEGDIDELNSYIGLAAYYVEDERVRNMLKRVQNELFSIGALLATKERSKLKVNEFGNEHTKMLEQEIERMSKALPEPKEFVIPGGCEGAVHLQVARALARRAERRVIKLAKTQEVESGIKSYLNRLSTYFYVAALYLNKSEGIEEEHPEY